MMSTTSLRLFGGLAAHRVAAFLLLSFIACVSAAQQVDLYCEVEGSSFFDELRRTHPTAGTFVYRIDSSRRAVANVAGIFSNDPVEFKELSESYITFEQVDSKLSFAPAVTAYRVTDIDRTTGRFTITRRYRDSSKKPLSQTALDTAYEQAGRPWLIAPKEGLELSGRCEVRQKLF
jgi:hypothetical protein